MPPYHGEETFFFRACVAGRAVQRSEGGRRRAHCHKGNLQSVYLAGDLVAVRMCTPVSRSLSFATIITDGTGLPAVNHAATCPGLKLPRICPACLIGLCERSLRTVIAVGTSPTAQLEELHPQRIWYLYRSSGYPPPSPAYAVQFATPATVITSVIAAEKVVLS